VVRAAALILALVAAPTSAERKAISLVKAELKDPDSAKFKGLRIKMDGTGCGWVNAKNSYGGYAGFQVFYVGKDGKVAFIPPDLSEPALCE
jgi:hypothetical protein